MSIISSLKNIALPALCPVCKHANLKGPEIICSNCRTNVYSGPYLPVFTSRNIKTVISCRPYRDTIKKCIHLLKYYNKRNFILVFKKMISNNMALRNISSGTQNLVIPVPVASSRRYTRGYNQSELIAKTLTELFPGLRICLSLKKKRNTVSQTNCRKKERMDNLNGSFKISGTNHLKGKDVILVDDVYTTGATMETCAKELKSSGTRKIYGFTLARTI